MNRTRQNFRQLWIGKYVLLLIIAVGFIGTSFAQESDGPNLAEINRQLNNPLTSIWSLVFRNTTSILDGNAVENSQTGNLLNFQPVLPIPIGKNLININRPIFPLVTTPTFNQTTGDIEHTTGLGDIVLLSMLGPSATSGFIWGLGPSFVFPTASNDALGKGKYQVGPAGVALYMSKEWVLGTLTQQWWSFAGNDDRPETSFLSAQYFIWKILPNAWQVGMAPVVMVDWKADSGNKVTFPVGLGFGKTVKLFGKMPFKIIAEIEYTIVRPDNLGQHWNFVLQITPVIPSPFGNIDKSQMMR
jgi:hypothetical protein